MCVSVSSNFGCKNNLSALHFSSVFLVVIGHYPLWHAILRVWRQTFKKSLITLSTIINLFTPAYDFTPQNLAAEIYQKRPLLDQNWELYDTTLILGTIKPWKLLALTMSYKISESQKRRDITLKPCFRRFFFTCKIPDEKYKHHHPAQPITVNDTVKEGDEVDNQGYYKLVWHTCQRKDQTIYWY